MAVMHHVWRVEGIGDQSFIGILHEEVFRASGVDADDAVAPFLLDLAKAQEGHMAADIVSPILRYVPAGQIPGAGPVRQLLGVLFEVESRGDQAVSDGAVLCISGKVQLVVRDVAGAVVGSKIRSRNHGQIVGIRRME